MDVRQTPARLRFRLATHLAAWGFVLSTSLLPVGAAAPRATAPLAPEALANAEYVTNLVAGGKAQFIDGAYDNRAEDVAIQLTRLRVNTDLNGDAAPDTAVIMTASTAASDALTVLAVVLNDGGKPRPVTAIVTGDHIRMINIVAGQAGTVVLSLYDHRAGQALSTAPTVFVRRTYRLQGERLVAVGALSLDALNNATYPMEGVKGGSATFANGRFEDEEAGISARLLPQRAVGDLDGDSVPDTVVSFSKDSDGSVLTYVAAVLNDNYRAVPVAVALIGERVTLNRVAIQDGAIAVSFLNRMANPTRSGYVIVRATRTFRLLKTAAQPSAVTYNCSEGKAFIIVFNDEVATLNFNGTTATLAKLAGTTGLRYGNAAIEFRGRDDEAYLLDPSTGNALAIYCTVFRP